MENKINTYYIAFLAFLEFWLLLYHFTPCGICYFWGEKRHFPPLQPFFFLFLCSSLHARPFLGGCRVCWVFASQLFQHFQHFQQASWYQSNKVATAKKLQRKTFYDILRRVYTTWNLKNSVYVYIYWYINQINQKIIIITHLYLIFKILY